MSSRNRLIASPNSSGKTTSLLNAPREAVRFFERDRLV